MNYDITFCVNESCTIKESCQRYNMDLIKKLKFVSMAEFRQNNSGTCDSYIEEPRSAVESVEANWKLRGGK